MYVVTIRHDHNYQAVCQLQLIANKGIPLFATRSKLCTDRMCHLYLIFVSHSCVISYLTYLYLIISISYTLSLSIWLLVFWHRLNLSCDTNHAQNLLYGPDNKLRGYGGWVHGIRVMHMHTTCYMVLTIRKLSGLSLTLTQAMTIV
jgi:hypothetical protein